MTFLRAKRIKLTIPARSGGFACRRIPTFNGKAVCKEWRSFGFELQELPYELHYLDDFDNIQFKNDPYYGANACVVGTLGGVDYLIYQNVTRRMKEKLRLYK